MKMFYLPNKTTTQTKYHTALLDTRFKSDEISVFWSLNIQNQKQHNKQESFNVHVTDVAVKLFQAYKLIELLLGHLCTALLPFHTQTNRYPANEKYFIIV